MPSNPRRDARRRAGFRKQDDLADWFGWNRGTIAHIECGSRPAPDLYDRLIDTLCEKRELEIKIEAIKDALK